MESSQDTRHHLYVSTAPSYEPATDEHCLVSPTTCRMTVRNNSIRPGSLRGDRQRPFSRSLGNHPEAGSTETGTTEAGPPPTTVVTNAESLAPDPTAPSPFAERPTAESDVPADVRRGADHAVRLLLEVLDNRRNAGQLTTWFAPTVVEAIRTLVKTGPPGHRLGGATLRRVHATRSSNVTTEIFATYARGPRVFAVAARIEHRSGPRKKSMTVTALRVL